MFQSQTHIYQRFTRSASQKRAKQSYEIVSRVTGYLRVKLIEFQKTFFKTNTLLIQPNREYV